MSRDYLSRERILEGGIRKLAESKPGVIRLMTDEDRAAWVKRLISENPEPEGLWVYGYGSLIWNPAFHFVERLRCHVQGFHRSFCMWTMLGRGSEELPGLMLGLEQGGSSNGVVYRIDPEVLEVELDIILRRELMSYTYIPTWVTAQCEGRKVQAITFVMDPEHERYACNEPEEKMIRILATAAGPLGRNCDYLYDLVETLESLEFKDDTLEDLAEKVREYQQANGIDCDEGRGDA